MNVKGISAQVAGRNLVLPSMLEVENELVFS